MVSRHEDAWFMDEGLVGRGLGLRVALPANLGCLCEPLRRPKRIEVTSRHAKACQVHEKTHWRKQQGLPAGSITLPVLPLIQEPAGLPMHPGSPGGERSVAKNVVMNGLDRIGRLMPNCAIPAIASVMVQG